MNENIRDDMCLRLSMYLVWKCASSVCFLKVERNTKKTFLTRFFFKLKENIGKHHSKIRFPDYHSRLDEKFVGSTTINIFKVSVGKYSINAGNVKRITSIYTTFNGMDLWV